jgi:hypothetical protein
MAWNPNQEEPVNPNPNTGYGAPSHPYGTPENPYGAPQTPYGAPQNPFAMPPNQNYGNAYNNQSGYMPPAASPLPLGDAIRQLPNQYIRVLTRPGAMTFAGEMGKAAWNIVWVQLIGYAVIATILSFIATQIGLGLATLGNSTSTASVNSALLGSIRSIEAGVSLGSIIAIPIGFFIGMGILFGLAKAFHGEGRFVTQCYTFLLFYAPLGIIASVIALIPIAGGFIDLAIDIFEIVLSVFAIQATHRLSGGKATAVVLIPVGVLLLLACAFIVVIVAIVASSVQQIH